MGAPSLVGTGQAAFPHPALRSQSLRPQNIPTTKAERTMLKSSRIFRVMVLL
jgi:hypothetical protein